MRTLLSMICLLYVTFISAQTSPPKLIEVTPPSPNAAALTKFGDMPVSLATGLPRVGIPIYTYKAQSGGLSVAVSLDYHAGGIRVKERASNVGLGWALNAGGAVTRTVRGIADETPANGYWAVAMPTNEFDGNSPANVAFRPFNNIAAGVRDGQLDLFSFNFGGRTGQFHFGKNNDTLMNVTERLRISKQVGTVNGQTAINRITIVDESGFTYVFAAPEMATVLGAVWTGSKHFTTAWYISEIIAPNGADKVVFEYDNTGINNYITSSGYTRYQRTSMQFGEISGSGSSAQAISGKRLKKVTFPDGVWIDFAYSTTQRTDLPGDYLLNKITINDGNNRRGFRLTQDYSLGRATLKQVVPFQGTSETADRPYVLQYFTSGQLPQYESGTDHWGYYVGPGFMGDQIPREVFPNGMGPYFEMPGVNRDTNPTYVKVGSLQQITYPTGGYTIFEMEANRANHSWMNKQFTVGGNTYSHIQQYVGGLRVKKISDYDGVSTTPVQVKEYEYVMPNGTTSSGMLGVYPTYTYKVTYDYRQQGWEVPTNEPYNPAIEYIVRSSSSVHELVYGGGSPVVYERVVEKRTANGVANGYTVSTFTTNQPVIGITMPITPPDQKNWSSGLLKQEDVYNSSNTLVKRTVNEYRQVLHNYTADPARMQRFRSIVLMPVKFLIPSGQVDYVFTPLAPPLYFFMRDYYPPAGRMELVRTTETLYEPTGSYQRILGHSYHASLFYRKTDTLTDSRGLKQITRYTYPPDMVSAGRDPNGVYAGMTTKNIIAPVIEQVSLQGTTQLDLLRTNYYQPFSGIYAPQTVVTKKRTLAEDTQLRYSAYNNRGRVLTAAVEKAAPTSYLWGYNGQYVIAEGHNAGEYDIAYVGFEFNESNLSLVNVSTPVDASAPTGRRIGTLSSSQSSKITKYGLSTGKAYILSYWVKDGSPMPSITGGTVTAAVQARTKGVWKNYRHRVSGTSTLVLGVTSGTVSIDDIRLHPVDAGLDTYTYDPLLGMTSHTDASGNIFYYAYDGFGRLSIVRDLAGKVVEDYQYKYRTN
ncbi:RHS repeat domain-containing protein [Parapedobacter koreensis]|uniref:YD repeat-containing protein n=1 Tax=Parapedobacter koreensis TaxID=332977 RepID=A0A1H7I295_9SPHI|nr:hypothetical protein [Parapedobacter koreensis]SEK54635.1 YD repeat-containing protein [Parapedobacter koreensis]